MTEPRGGHPLGRLGRLGRQTALGRLSPLGRLSGLIGGRRLAGRARGVRFTMNWRAPAAWAARLIGAWPQRRPDTSTGEAATPRLVGAIGRGLAFTGTVWIGGESEPRPGTVIIDGDGRISTIVYGIAPSLPSDLLVLGADDHWIVPGIIDAHVHLGFDPGAATEIGRPFVSGLDTGLVGVRDLGAPLHWARLWQTTHRVPPSGQPSVAVSGPILTAPEGYPSRSWGAVGYAEFVTSPAHARSVVQYLAAEGVDLIKLALEPGGTGWPVLPPEVLRAVVESAHALGLPVVAHALTADLVARAVEARVDELAHTPTERLGPELIERVASSGLSVTSTLQTFFSSGAGRDAADNAADLVAAGVRLRYGTDLGNAGTRPGVDPRELDRLADTGLGRLGALRAATEFSASAPGVRGRTGRLAVSESAALVLLPFSPLAEPGVWRTPAAVFSDGRLTVAQSTITRLPSPESSAP